MWECAVVIIILFVICYFIKKKSKRKPVANHSTFLEDSFDKLDKMNIADCVNTTRATCVTFGKTNLSNVFQFYSDDIQFSYKQSYLTFIEQNGELNDSRKAGFKKVKKKFKLKVFGFKDVILTQEGSIHSKCWDLTTYGGCKCWDLREVKFDKKNYVEYDKVISISHQWGYAVYHSIGECLPKLGYYIPELLKDDSIVIHTHKSACVQYLHFLGFNSSRIVFGNIYAKRLLSLEKGNCFSPPPVIYTQSLRNNLRYRIKSKPIYDIVLIKRAGSRDIINFDEVYNSLKKVYKKKKVVIFYPNTSFSDTLNYFKYAKLIVSPHGAGLSNMVLSEDCRVIEFAGFSLCLTALGSGLGLEYYGIYQPLYMNRFIVNITFFEKILNKIKI